MRGNDAAFAQMRSDRTLPMRRNGLPVLPEALRVPMKTALERQARRAAARLGLAPAAEQPETS